MNIDLFFIIAVCVVLLALVVAVVILIKNNKLNVIREHCYYLFLVAENIYGSKKGPEKLAYVCNKAYETLFPAWLKTLIDRETVTELVQKWFDDVTGLTKDYLDNGMLDHSANKTSKK